MYPFIYNMEGQGYTLFINGNPHTVKSSDFRYAKLDEVFDKYSKGEFSEDDVQNDRLAMQAIDSILTSTFADIITDGVLNDAEVKKFEDLQLTFDGDELVGCSYKGVELPKVLADKFFNMYKDGCKTFDPYFKFIDNIMKNPRDSVREELYDFLAAEELPIHPNGTFIAYKGVRDDLFSCTGSHKDSHGNFTTTVLQGTVDKDGHIYNGVGETIRVRVTDVETDRSIGCAQGLHVGSYEYASGFGSVTLAVEVNPMDVVSVPTDCSCQKCRVSQYTVKNIVSQRYETPTVDEDDDGACVATNNDPRTLDKGRLISSLPVDDIADAIEHQVKTHHVDKNGCVGPKLPGYTACTSVSQIRGSVGKKHSLSISEIMSVLNLYPNRFKLHYKGNGMGSTTVSLY